MYTELMKKFEQYREDSSFYTDEEKLKLLDLFDEDQRRLEDSKRTPTLI